MRLLKLSIGCVQKEALVFVHQWLKMSNFLKVRYLDLCTMIVGTIPGFTVPCHLFLLQKIVFASMIVEDYNNSSGDNHSTGLQIFITTAANALEVMLPD